MKVIAAMLASMLALLLPSLGAAQVEQEIVGAWEWHSTGCDNGEIVLTPESEGYTRQDIFGAIAEGASYRRFIDGTMAAEGTYLISHPENPITGLVVDVIDITIGGATNRFAYLWVQEDTGQLGMSDGVCDWLWTARGPVASDGLTWGTLKRTYS